MRLEPWLDSKNFGYGHREADYRSLNTAAALRRFAPIQTRNSRGLI
jgi:hypothetical protein